MYWILIFLMIVFCSGYYYAITTQGATLTLFVLVVGTILLLWHKCKRTKKICFSKNRIIFSMIFIFLIIVSGLINGNLGLSGAKLILTVMVSLLITECIDWNSFKSLFVKGMVIISLFAILGYFFIHILNLDIFPRIQNYNGETYISGIFFSNLIYEYVGTTDRLQGVFWEPGLFATYLNMAILFCSKDMMSKFKYVGCIALFSICLIMTKSGAGLMLLPICFCVKYLIDNRHNSNPSLKTIVICLFLFALVMSEFAFGFIENNEYINRYVISKWSDKDGISLYSRVGSFAVDFIIGADNLFCGVGMDGYAGAIRTYSGSIVSSGTSTLTAYFAQFGVWGILIVAAWCRCAFKISTKLHWLARLGIISIFAIILSKEPHTSLLFMNTLLLYSWGKDFTLLSETSNCVRKEVRA